MTWERTAERYLTAFESARRGHRLRVIARLDQNVASRDSHAAPEMRTDHLLSMCDDTGLFQHAVHSVPDRAHGYCVDDNARALLLACALNGPGEQRLPEALTARFAAFVQHAWNPDTKRFRNFMSFDRRWLEDSGSEDSHGRTLWALGECARGDASASRRRWAAALFAEALPPAENFSSPRAWAFTLLGLDAYCAVAPEDSSAKRVRQLLADRLMSILSAVETKDWVWFEEGLAYDNARLPQALIVTGTSTGAPAYVEAGLRSLRWLMTLQTTPAGLFRPVGTQGFGDKRQAAAGVRSAAAGGHGDDLGLPCGMARRWRCRMESRRRACLRLVPRQQRSVAAAGRPGHGQLSRWAASRPREREQGRRVRRVLSSQPRGDSSARADQRR